MPPEASACTLWGGIRNNSCQDRLVLRSAPHVLRRGRYRLLFDLNQNQLASCSVEKPVRPSYSDRGAKLDVRETSQFVDCIALSAQRVSRAVHSSLGYIHSSWRQTRRKLFGSIWKPLGYWIQLPRVSFIASQLVNCCCSKSEAHNLRCFCSPGQLVRRNRETQERHRVSQAKCATRGHAASKHLNPDMPPNICPVSAVTATSKGC